MLNFASILAAFEELVVLEQKYAPYGAAALAALQTGGVKGLIAYLETLIAQPTPAGPPVALAQGIVAKLRA